MNGNYNISLDIVNQLEAAGLRAAFLPYHAINQIKKTYDNLAEKTIDIPYAHNSVIRFHNQQPPAIPFEPLSFLIAANPCDPAQIIFNIKDNRITVPIPPLFHGNVVDWKVLDDTLGMIANEYQAVPTRGISQKLLAVHSGLGKYGRNNICYIDPRYKT